MFNMRNLAEAVFITLVSMLSMQSRTKSGLPDRISSSEDGSYNSTFASIWHSGYIVEKCFLRQNAFGVPTSSLVATACRFSDESETFQYIMSVLLMSTYYKCSILLIEI
jgi:hypothetical protein